MESQASTWPKYQQVTESMQDHKDIDIIFSIQLDIVSIFIGSQQTQHVAIDINKHGTSEIIDTFETYQDALAKLMLVTPRGSIYAR